MRAVRTPSNTLSVSANRLSVSALHINSLIGRVPARDGGQGIGPGGDAWGDADCDAMRAAMRLAWRGAGRTGTNPMVGSVVTVDGRVIAAGFHGQEGAAHAEVIALDAAGEAARGSTLYASLEPCAHHGRTPPCTDRIIAAGVARVVIPALDPDPRVLGRGVELLRAAGIRVDIGCLDAAAIMDNLGYYRDRLGFPSLVTLKMALSRDGMVASARGRRDPITGNDALSEVHALRAAHDAVVIGINTMLIDSPRLDCRLLSPGPHRLPVPVVLDSRLRTPADNAWSRAARPFVVVTGVDADAARADAIEARGGSVIRCARTPQGVDIDEAVGALAARGFHRLLVEGGPAIVASFLSGDRWDAAWYYRAPVTFGPAGVPLSPQTPPGALVDSVAVGADERIRVVGERTRAEIEAAFRQRAAV
jgi:diaminohydroxyphosphoribosylaminopyrimidine deaminase/5-amino-6-(5-phosphoribosylamino)uracil reductase